MKHFFTRRRKGAKEKIEPKHPRFVGYAVDDAVNAVLDQVLSDKAKNLSAFAPVRETSATQSRKESFSPRRKEDRHLKRPDFSFKS